MSAIHEAQIDDTSIALSSCQPLFQRYGGKTYSQASEARTSELHSRRKSGPTNGNTVVMAQNSKRTHPEISAELSSSASQKKRKKSTSPKQTCCKVVPDHAAQSCPTTSWPPNLSSAWPSIRNLHTWHCGGQSRGLDLVEAAAKVLEDTHS